MSFRTEILGSSRSSRKADRILERERVKAFGKDGGIKCICHKCGNIGYAQDETILDENGYLKDMFCPCGGKIHRVSN